MTIAMPPQPMQVAAPTPFYYTPSPAMYRPSVGLAGAAGPSWFWMLLSLAGVCACEIFGQILAERLLGPDCPTSVLVVLCLSTLLVGFYATFSNTIAATANNNNGGGGEPAKAV